MSEFIILSDSCCDLSKENREKYGIEYAAMRVMYDDNGTAKDIPADLDWKELGFKQFYDMMRDGTRFRTSQVNAPVFEEIFTKYAEAKKDVLYISCSSALSSSYKQSLIAKEAVLKKYPDAKIYLVDSLNSCHGLGIMCLAASDMRAEGKSAEETAGYIEKHKLEVNQLATVDSLTYLKRAGRVSVMSAVFGGLLQVKPILISDVTGQNLAVEKVKGRKNSLVRIADLVKENITEHDYQRLFVVHADCEDEAKTLKDMISERLGKDVKIDIQPIGPIIGASTGPATVAAYFFGKEVTAGGKE